MFGQHSLVPIEFEISSLKVFVEERMFADQSLREREFALEKLEETRVQSAVRLKLQQATTKRSHDKKLKPIPLALGDLVLLYDSRFVHSPGKLHTCWL